ncbi:hypothetical protein PR048_004066 [Dryococelus australis]|uniref:PiggyBac transposable element-derived protein domain-containing protein n=1 Tax=Dryococelus australis TaxID=614101 RepID=A0ABQ9I4F1_9NEOP|nr:hypothetical protein PR048_004066 [Dryococelus australis]
MNLSDSDDSESGFEPANCIVDVCQLPPDEDGRLTDEEQVNEDQLNEVTPADVCGMIEVHLHSLGSETSNPGAEEADTSTSQFFGLLLQSGYHSVPTEDMYWGIAEDVEIPFVPKVMPRNKFREINKYLHLMDNTELRTDNKMGKSMKN